MTCKCKICRIVELYYQILQKSEQEVVRRLRPPKVSPKQWSYKHCFKAIDIIRKRDIHNVIIYD